ncbi:hypothetical protein CPB85DRAFT_535602 [Mucidula mucida]|nr:hypothetical protein CPB85DRAFT_535602 [Mucidula mucida]
MDSTTRRVIAPQITNFIATLWRIAADPTNCDIVSWGSSGDCFVVHNVDQFVRLVIPCYFRCTMYLSFVRQLHKYGFQRCYSSEIPSSSQAYSHPYFNFYRPEDLSLIRTEHVKSQSGPEIAPEYPLYLVERVARLSRVQAEFSPQLEILDSHSREMKAILEDMQHAYRRRESWLAYITETIQSQLVDQLR